MFVTIAQKMAVKITQKRYVQSYFSTSLQTVHLCKIQAVLEIININLKIKAL